VCELGWVFEGGLPRPTLCTWGEAVPAGPLVYGLTAWGEGLEVEGDRVELSPGMLLAMLPRDGQPFALLNDDQRLDERGTVTRCGVGSLCSNVGLRVGDRLVFEGSELDELLDTGSTRLEVVPPRGRSRWLSVSLRP
jgi:hypothetical protein